MVKTSTFDEIISTALNLNPGNYALNQLQREINNYLELENREYSVISAIKKVLNSKDLKQFQHLSPGFQEANVAIALNCGNGVVAKIIPNEFVDKLPDITGSGFGRSPFHVPSFDSYDVASNRPVSGFKVKFYPFIKDNHVMLPEIADYKSKILEYGLEVTRDDDRPVNFRRLPDKKGTVVAIDSDMLKVVDEEKFKMSAPILDKWIDYMAKIYPIYKTKEIPPQKDGFIFSETQEAAIVASKHLEFSPRENPLPINPGDIKAQPRGWKRIFS